VGLSIQKRKNLHIYWANVVWDDGNNNEVGRTLEEAERKVKECSRIYITELKTSAKDVGHES
jgi:16S rRNA U516 pseudouridylate synthase RsuA-like enzyme